MNCINRGNVHVQEMFGGLADVCYLKFSVNEFLERGEER